MKERINIFWFRRDLRLHDNAGLFYALQQGLPVLPLFIFDKNILDELENKTDARVDFIYRSVKEIKTALEKNGNTIFIQYGSPLNIFKALLTQYVLNAVFTNHDYEPYAIKRDDDIKKILGERGIAFNSYKDQVIFEKEEVQKDNGQAYTVYTPYANKWVSQLNKESLAPFIASAGNKAFLKAAPLDFPSLEQMGFQSFPVLRKFPEINEGVISSYEKTRNFPFLDGTSRSGIHLRFGNVSIRDLAVKALERNRTFLKELIWREFFMQLLWRQPRLVTQSFKTEYDNIQWRNNEKEFQLWCQGETGFPLVDAGMRELNATGFMHNRVRMVTASFLVKHLLIDWRWGEAYFARKLLDYDLAANNGNWQWVAGCGCDAAPYFRIFNPQLQAKKFDPEGKYIQKWVPEINSFQYPGPMVDHEMARQRCLTVYKKALEKTGLLL
ncbi:MAG: deoxyribodipyrimidine photo-lyase [Flavisolibacter sp.]